MMQDISRSFPIIGTDESGKGDYFGPLVSAAVYVDERIAAILTELGVRDSKLMSDSRNIGLSAQIREVCAGGFAVIEISPERYNTLYAQFRQEKKNLNTLLAWGHAKAIEELLSKIPCDTAITDQFADERFILSKLQEKGKRLRLVQMPKAEQHVAVAAASILARARFLEKLSRLSAEYKVDLPKGASDLVVRAARKFVETHGTLSLRMVAKMHFKTTAEVIKNCPRA
jgi:ribonuclease HIII